MDETGLTVQELIDLLSKMPPKAQVRGCEPGSWEADRGDVLHVHEFSEGVVYLTLSGRGQ